MKVKRLGAMIISLIILIGAVYCPVYAEGEEVVHVEHELSDENISIRLNSKENMNSFVGQYMMRKYNIDPAAEIQIVSGNIVTNIVNNSKIKYKYVCTNSETYTITVNYKIVQPSVYQISKDTEIYLLASHNDNASASALLNRVNKDLNVTVSGDAWDNAIGTTEPYTMRPFTWDDCDKQFDPAGGVTYLFNQQFLSTTLTRKVVVEKVKQAKPNVYVDYDTRTLIGTDGALKWTLDPAGNVWSSCTPNMIIQSDWYGKIVYFRYPATTYSAASEIAHVQIPVKQNAPKVKLELKSTSHSITIMNCWDYDNAEYSINGLTYFKTTDDTFTFDNLVPNKKYNVYVRTTAVYGQAFPSDPVTYTISTEDGTLNSITIDYGADSNEAHVYGTGTVEYEVEDNYTVGSYDAEVLNRYKNIVNGYVDKKLDVTARLSIIHNIEENETRNINGFRFSIPINPLIYAIKNTDLDLAYVTDYLTVELDNDSLYDIYRDDFNGRIVFDVKKVTSINSSSSNYKWLKQQVQDGRPVFILETTYGDDNAYANYYIPYTIGSNEAARNIEVYYVNTRNGTRVLIDSEYDEINKVIKFTTNKSGYFVVALGEMKPMNFYDVSMNSWYYKYVEYCYNQGIFQGVSDTMFEPETNINRAMIYALLSRIAGADVDKLAESAGNEYGNKNTWYFPYLYWAYQTHLTSTFEREPGATMTRAEIATVLYRFMQNMQYQGMINANLNIDEIYDDVADESYETRYALIFMYNNGIMEGMGNRTFAPNSPLRRCEMATLMYRLDHLAKGT